MRRALIALAGLALFAAAPAQACSVVSGYVVPSNFRLVERAQLVVLARVVSGPSAEQLGEDSWDNPRVALQPIRAIKGAIPAEPLKVKGYVSLKGRGFAPHPTPLHRAHPSTYYGACIRQEYAVGALVVAVFEKTGEGWRQQGSPFARSVEDVEGENGTWVRAADAYVRIAALPASNARAKALQAEAARLLALRDDPAAPAIAADMLDIAEGETL
jgi:hypothetical protein